MPFQTIPALASFWLLAVICYAALLALLPFVPTRWRKWVGAVGFAAVFAVPNLVPYYCCWCGHEWWCPCYLINCG